MIQLILIILALLLAIIAVVLIKYSGPFLENIGVKNSQQIVKFYGISYIFLSITIFICSFFASKLLAILLVLVLLLLSFAFSISISNRFK